jgi:phosphate-selective porin
LEAALRFSYVDLNGKSIRGGREHNLTAGLNWYLTEKNRETPPLIEDGIADILQVRFQIIF